MPADPVWAGMLANLGGFETTAAIAGELVSQAEDMADDADLVNDELNSIVDNLSKSSFMEENWKSTAKADELASSVRDILEKVREAKEKVAGAAAAAKKFAAAKPEIEQAKNSFNGAKKKLKEYEAAKAQAYTVDAVKDFRDKLIAARRRMVSGIEHLKAALVAII